ncbi:helix-turn-helix domain-containing protein [Lactobacillus sp. ESL0230]|uniref:helix-turn-helix domain-containing protein n=1 Tax=Lactobacillus sp. ESL0230 TaxID=2069353 RepID=UPI000EFAB824|nr:helix-turn-helix transcriptional regulator [Lactobacillus sp. ESL0230]RMC46585.1 XRE family transcriptional regulator [Lactobacillus sp. ESL0230]
MANLGSKLKAYRNSKKLTLEQLAQALNSKYSNAKISKGRLSRWENDKEEPKLSSLKLLADYFDVSLDNLIGLNEEIVSNTTPEYLLKDKSPSNKDGISWQDIDLPYIGEVPDELKRYFHAISKVYVNYHPEIIQSKKIKDETKISKYIGLQIKKLRKSLDMDQQTFADKIGTLRINVSRYENGLRNVNSEIIFKIAKEFNIDINYFFPKI